MRLIDADALIAYINDDIDQSKEMREEAKARNNEVEKSYNNGEIVEARRIKRYVNTSATTIDAAPVVHGHYGFVGLGVRAVEIMFGTCSECRERIGWYSHNTYCPNCGAKMDGGADDGTRDGTP